MAADSVLRKRSYMVAISNSFNELAREKAYIETMVERRVDGLLLTSVQIESETWRWLNRCQIPFVLMNRRFANYSTPYVGVDNLGGMLSVVDHLISMGHHRIGFISGLSHSSSARNRYYGYLEAHQSQGMDVDPELYFEGRYEVTSGQAGAEYLLSLPEKQRPTAIVCANELSALGVMSWAKDHSVGVPGELSVTGFDNSEVAKFYFVGLTTVKQPREKWASSPPICSSN